MDGAHADSAVCVTCGERHPDCFTDLLGAMYRTAREEAQRRLSPQGMETLAMLEHVTDVLGLADAYDAAGGVEKLPSREARIVEIFLARKTLIDATRKAVCG